MTDYDSLKTRAEQVRDEQTIGGNTALRVGQLLCDMVDDMEEIASKTVFYLDSMGEELDGASIYIGPGMVFYDPDAGVIKTCVSPGVYDITPCVETVIYCNKATNILYRWSSASHDMIQIAGAGGEGEGGSLTAEYDGVDTLIITDAETMVVLKVDRNTISMGDTEVNTQKVANLVVTGKNLTSGITLALTDPDNVFALSTNLISQANANQSNTVVVTYEPDAIASSTATILLTSGSKSVTVDLTGNGVAQVVPTITMAYGESYVALTAAEGSTATLDVPIVGANLTPGTSVSVSASGTGISVQPQTFVADENGEFSGTLTISYTAGSADVTGGITATGGGATASLEVRGSVVVPLAAGSYWYDGVYRFQVLNDTTKVGISQNPNNKPRGEITLPTSANDAGKTVYDSGGNIVPSSGMTYQVTQIINHDANSSPFLGARITKVTVPEGYTNLTLRTFDYGSSNTGVLTEVYLPSTLVAWGGGWDFRNQPLEKLVIAATQTWPESGFYINAPLKYVEIGLGVTNCNKQNMYLNIASNTKVVARPTTPPVVAYNFFGSSYTQGTLYVPAAAKSAYEAANYWNNFATIKTIENDLENDLDQ